MKKSVYIVFAITLITALLSGCHSNGYRYVLEDDGGYIILSDLRNDAQVSSQEIAPEVIFTSFEEMRSDISNGNFTDEELREIARFNKNENGTIQVCNLNNLCEPMCPANFEYQISWSGAGYHFKIKNEEADSSTSLYLSSKEQYDSRAERCTNGSWVPTGFDESEVQVTTSSDRNAFVYHCSKTTYKGNIVTEKHIMYSFDVDGAMYYVWEQYEEETDDVPRCIHISGCSNGYYFRANIYSLSERPSIEWLSQFGLKEYVETEAS